MNGIDISNWNIPTGGSINWSKVKTSGVKYVYIKATEGESFVNPYVDLEYNGAVGQGCFKIGFYHFLIASSTPEKQAEHFWNQISSHGRTYQLKPCLDVEASGFNVSDYTRRFIAKFKELSNNTPILIYSGAYYSRDNFDSDIKANYPLWVAYYGQSEFSSTVKNITGFKSLVGHQFSSTGSIPGIVGNVDLDQFLSGVELDGSGSVSASKPASSSSQSPVEKGKAFVGSRAKELQQKLNKVGYSLDEDGIFGPKTYDAVISFQKKYGLMVDGLAGVQVFSKLDTLIAAKGSSDWVRRLQAECNAQGFSHQTVDGVPGPNTLAGCPTLKYGCKGSITKLLQEKLNGLGYTTAGVDGIFGQQTKAAVIAYQKDRGLSADGIVGRLTWSKLLILS